MSTASGSEAAASKKRSPAPGKSKGGKGGEAAQGGAAIELRWDLATLPSAQHRAGLAGLVLMVRWLERLPSHEGVCELVDLSDVGVTLRVDRVSRRTFSDSSRLRMVWLSVDCEIPSRAAARVKLRSSATAAKA